MKRSAPSRSAKGACAACRWFEPPKAGERVAVAAAAGIDLSRGVCVRYPATVAKRPDERCGEFGLAEPTAPAVVSVVVKKGNKHA